MSFVNVKDCRKTYVGRGSADDPTIEFFLKDLSAEQEQQLALVGPSGCGKTTLLNLISGIITPDSGEIQVGDARLDQLSARAMDRFRGTTIGYIFQGFNLIQPLTALQNVLVAVSSVLISLYFSTVHRRRDLALMRVLGARPWERPPGRRRLCSSRCRRTRSWTTA